MSSNQLAQSSASHPPGGFSPERVNDVKGLLSMAAASYQNEYPPYLDGGVVWNKATWLWNREDVSTFAKVDPRTFAVVYRKALETQRDNGKPPLVPVSVFGAFLKNNQTLSSATFVSEVIRIKEGRSRPVWGAELEQNQQRPVHQEMLALLDRAEHRKPEGVAFAGDDTAQVEAPVTQRVAAKAQLA